MAALKLATIAAATGPTAAVVIGDRLHPIAGRPSMRALLDDWDAWLARLDAEAERGALEPGVEVAQASLLAPLPDPRNLYMAGANYADHAREMRGLPADAPIAKVPEGPFIFLKPTTTVVGPGAVVRLDPACTKLDWEVELAAVIGRRVHRATAADALAAVAGYTVVNDVSARDHFRRGEQAEPPMAFDWFGQKGWDTSCPAGPWIVPARDIPDPGDLALRLSVNGTVRQRSHTSGMIFSLQEQIAHISAVVPLLPGDVICTGTPAGVGAGKGTFLRPGDVMVAEIEGIGRLENTVVAAREG
jgi:2,4-didehydro-3-deoxy-L-rhamnonate hydrolase